MIGWEKLLRRDINLEASPLMKCTDALKKEEKTVVEPMVLVLFHD